MNSWIPMIITLGFIGQYQVAFAESADTPEIDRLLYNGLIACEAGDYDRCATLAARAVQLAPSSQPARQLMDIAKRRGGKRKHVFENPGFQSGLYRLSLGYSQMSFDDQQDSNSIELYVGKRPFDGATSFFVELTGGIVVGRMRLFDDEGGFLEPAGTFGFGIRPLIGYEFPISRLASVGLLGSVGVRVLTQADASDLDDTTLFDIGIGPNFQYGRLTFEALLQASWAHNSTVDEYSEALWGVVFKTSIAVGGAE